MKNKNPSLKLVKTSTEVFNPPSNYQFKIVNGIKIETVESFLNRGGEITYEGTISDPFHATNNPQHEEPKGIIKKAA